MTDPSSRWDDPSYEALRQALGRMLAAERRLKGREQGRKPGTLSHAHLRALFVLMREEEATAGTLARTGDLNPASVTTMIDHLEAQGLVQRRRDTHDRRSVWISLTDVGRKEVGERERQWRARADAEFADITADELAAATKVLDRISIVMEQLADQPTE